MDYTRWLDTRNTSLDQINNILINKHEDDLDDESTSSRYTNWNIQKIHSGSLNISTALADPHQKPDAISLEIP